MLFAGSGIGAGGRAQAAGSGLLDQMVTDFQNAGFTVYASYDAPKNVRLDTDGVSAFGVDDERCTTSTGELYLPVVGGVLCGNYAGLDGLAQATITMWVSPAMLSGFNAIVSRHRNSSSGSQFTVRFSSGKIQFTASNGVNEPSDTTNAVMAVGQLYKITVTVDLSQAAGGQVHIYTEQFDFAAQAFGVEIDQARTTNGAYGAAFLAPQTTNLSLGSEVTSSNGGNSQNGLKGSIYRVRIRPGVVLTAAQRVADSMNPNESDPNWVPAALRYEMQGSANNTGTVAGFNGTIPSTACLCSDDLRWGPIVGSSGTNRLIYDPVAKEFSTNGVNTFAEGIGGLLMTMPADTYRILVIGTPPSGVGAWVDTGSAVADQLAIEVPVAGQLEAISHRGTGPTATLVPGAGVRAITARLISTNQVAILDGSGAEVAGAIGNATLSFPLTVSFFANGGGANFAPSGGIRKVMLLKATTGNTASLQAVVDKYAQTFFGAGV